MRIKAPLLLLALLTLSFLGATAAAAQDVELTPFVGVRFGGDFVDEFGDIFVDLEVEDGSSFGAILDIPLSPSWNLEFFYSHQESELVGDEGLFGNEFFIADLDVDYFHVGAQYYWDNGNIKPFIGASVGATRFAPDGFDSETRPSVAFSGGVKIMFNDNLGVRLEGRATSTLVDDNDDDVFCRGRDRFDCYGYDDEYFFQGEGLAGLIISF